MRLPRFSFFGHFVLLCAFCTLLVLLWALPALLMGYPYDVPSLLFARNFAEGGGFVVTDTLGRVLSVSMFPEGMSSAADGRLSAVILSLFHFFLGWDALVAWTVVGAALLSGALLFWWLTVYKIFDATTAWIAMVITALMPIYWREAVWLTPYNAAFFFFFASMASFVWLQRRLPIAAYILSGLLYGCAIAAKDVFLVFLPWFTIMYAWSWRPAAATDLSFRSQCTWQRALLLPVLFLSCAGGTYLLPYIADIRERGYPMNQNLARLWPGAEKIANETYLHLYPDPYTYHFDRERFDAEFLARVQTQPLLKRLQEEKLILGYGLERSIVRSVILGSWLLLHDVPNFFHRNTIGGIFLWLFILPGIFVFWQRDRRVVWWCAGLIGSMYLIIRFVLGYERSHFVNIGWIIALFAAVGVRFIAQSVSEIWPEKKVYPASLIFLVLILAVQLLQANRYELAQHYQRTTVPATLAATSVLRDLPQEAVVALYDHPNRIEAMAFLADRTLILFHPETTRRLADDAQLNQVFAQYGVTHVFGYERDIAAQMKRAVPLLTITEKPEASSSEPSVLLNYLLHLIR